MRNRILIPYNKVNCVQDIVVSRDKENNGMGRKEVIQVISEILQSHPYAQTENNLD